MRFVYPFEITKLYAVKDKEPEQIDTEISYAFAVQENFDTIRKYLNEIIDADNIVQNSLTGGTTGSIALTTITGDNIVNNTITGTQIANNTITLANLGATWTNWTPTYSANGSMTFTSVSTNWARYFRIDKTVFFWIWADGATGGTADSILYFTPPVEAIDSTPAGMDFPCCIYELSTYSTGKWNFDISGAGVSDKIAVMKSDNSNWGLGAGRGFQIQGFYEVA